jgi:hypothetical protein
MRLHLIAATLLLASPLLAQGYGSAPGIVQTPEIQLGSDLTPSIIKIPPVVVETAPPGEESAPTVSNATPANTQLLASRHFDFIVSPVEQVVPGSMEDTTVSLGDYARQLRAQKQTAPTPGAMARPSDCQ